MCQSLHGDDRRPGRDLARQPFDDEEVEGLPSACRTGPPDSRCRLRTDVRGGEKSERINPVLNPVEDRQSIAFGRRTPNVPCSSTRSAIRQEPDRARRRDSTSAVRRSLRRFEHVTQVVQATILDAGARISNRRQDPFP